MSKSLILHGARAMAALRNDAEGDGAILDMYGDLMQAAIETHKAALAKAGLVIVPRDPTEAMCTAGDDVAIENWPCAYAAWRAMIDAALAEDPDKPARARLP